MRWVSQRTGFAFVALGLGVLGFAAGCGRKMEPAAVAGEEAKHAGHEHEHGHGHEHHAPHGGAVVVLGGEAYHLELVHDAEAGTLKAFVLDGEMENFIRIAAAEFDVKAKAKGETEARVLTFRAISDAATGERVGDTATFEASSEWLRTAREFEGVVEMLTIGGSEFRGVVFRFSGGNEGAEAE
jgi:hypothetical protein